eukprot:Gb_40463 [translate_table: standard]
MQRSSFIFAFKAPIFALSRFLLSLLLLEGVDICYLTSPNLVNCFSSSRATFGGELLLQKRPVAIGAEGEPLWRCFEAVEVVESIGGRLSQDEVLLDGFVH